MLKLYICVPCEKVIIAKDDVPSLIGLFSKIMIARQEGIEIPANAVAPKEWAIFSQWDPEPGDELKTYMLCTKIEYPDGTPFGELSKTKVNIIANRRSQVTIGVPGFPIGQFGDYMIRTWIEENEKMVTGPIEFKVGVEAQAAPPSTST